MIGTNRYIGSPVKRTEDAWRSDAAKLGGTCCGTISIRKESRYACNKPGRLWKGQQCRDGLLYAVRLSPDVP
jgi:hypothetical protein